METLYLNRYPQTAKVKSCTLGNLFSLLDVKFIRRVTSLLSIISSFSVLESSFAEGQASGNCGPAHPSDSCLLRRHILVEDDFYLIHNILYYLHTNEISFATDITIFNPVATGYPKLCPAEQIYAAAHRLLLDDLEAKALNFLKSTCTIENITSRVLSEFAMLYKDVGDMYADYFRNNWTKVRTAKSHSEFFEEMEARMDFAELKRVFQRYRTIMEDIQFRSGCKISDQYIITLDNLHTL